MQRPGQKPKNDIPEEPGHFHNTQRNQKGLALAINKFHSLVSYLYPCLQAIAKAGERADLDTSRGVSSRYFHQQHHRLRYSTPTTINNVNILVSYFYPSCRPLRRLGRKTKSTCRGSSTISLKTQHNQKGLSSSNFTHQ